MAEGTMEATGKPKQSVKEARGEEVDGNPARVNGDLNDNKALINVKEMEEEEVDEGRICNFWRTKRRFFWLSICSVIFGCSCVGIYALISAVKATERNIQGDVEAARKLRRRAVKFSHLSFLVLVASVLLSLLFIVIVSYLVRLAE
ncbi:transmembrane protein 265-like [Hemitrygon akajei]|uniref:transmembrane protein 265-like n=1 Tax=Hemitrygon akajei TaxID=2704970 RepID=UPI003BF9DF08